MRCCVKPGKPEARRCVAVPIARQDSETVPGSSSGLPRFRPPSHPPASRQDSGKDGSDGPAPAGMAYSGATASDFNGLPYAWHLWLRGMVAEWQAYSQSLFQPPRINLQHAAVA